MPEHYVHEQNAGGPSGSVSDLERVGYCRYSRYAVPGKAMPKILGIKDIIKERLTETGQVVGDRFKLAVRSIYGSSDGKTVSHIGSGTLLSYRGHAFVVTASHVVDHAEYSALHILGEKKFVLLDGEVWRTKAPNKKRDDDKFDFAIWPISAATVEQLG